MLMKCGHESQATYQATKDSPVQDSCVICWDPHTTDWRAPEDNKPDLTNRQAQCSCGRTRPSDPDKLAFFEYRGPGSKIAARACKHCGFYEEAHSTGFWNKSNGDLSLLSPRFHAFKPHGPYDFDEFYCGCRGWD